MTIIPDIRTGLGFDAHRLLLGDGVWLGGVRIPCPYALEAHSDGDVLLHALTDALLGAMGEGDIGQHFPPTDPQWAGKASSHFVTHAMELLGKKGGKLVNLDTIIIGEVPKIHPHRQAIAERMASLVSLPLQRVNVKATTTEKMGFAGRKEGLAAQAIVTIFFPPVTA